MVHFVTFDVERFRGFDELRVDHLSKINLITGKNNTGKTSLLEAIFCLLGPNNPQIPTSVNAFRGLGISGLDPESVWASLFRRYKTNQVIRIEGIDDERCSYTLEIAISQPRRIQISRNGDTDEDALAATTPALSTETSTRDLVLSYSDSRGRNGRSIGTISPKEVKFEPMDLQPFHLGIYVPARLIRGPDDAQRFSDLEAVGEEGKILEALKLLDPRLRKLSVLVSGGVPLVHGDVQEGRLIPIALMGEGLAKLLSISLSIAAARHGFVLIDEIENGIHYSALKGMWRSIADIAQQSDTQIFATTHSWECIKAAHAALQPNDGAGYNLRLVRLDRVSGGKVKSVTYDQETLSMAIESNMEVR